MEMVRKRTHDGERGRFDCALVLEFAMKEPIESRKPVAMGRSEASAARAPDAQAPVSVVLAAIVALAVGGCYVPETGSLHDAGRSPQTGAPAMGGPASEIVPGVPVGTREELEIPARPREDGVGGGETADSTARIASSAVPETPGARASDAAVSEVLAEAALLSAVEASPRPAVQVREPEPTAEEVLLALSATEGAARPEAWAPLDPLDGVSWAPEAEAAAPPAVGSGAASSPAPAAGGIDLARAREILARAALVQEGGGPEATAAAPAVPEEAPTESPAAPAEEPAEAVGDPAPEPAAKPEPPPSPEDGAAAPAPAAEAPPEGQASPESPAAPERPKGIITLKEMYHKTAEEFLAFARRAFPDWVEKGNVSKVEGKGRTILVLGDTPEPTDPITLRILDVVDNFDQLELKLEGRKIRPRYVDVRTVMDAMVMRGVANVWLVSETTNVQTWKAGDKNVSATTKGVAYSQTGVASGQDAPIVTPPRVPYVYEILSTDPFPLPLNYSGEQSLNRPLINFDKQSSTEERGAMMAVGTDEDLARIQAFVDSIDMPARQILIEVEVIQLEAGKLTDFGIDSMQFGGRHTIGSTALPLPGETVVQPGLPAVRRDGVYVPPISQQGFGMIFDDTTEDLAGRFIFNVHALVRTGEAKVKARPKILTLDDRPSILHIGQSVPVFRSTGVTRDATVGSYVSQVNQVDNIYVGFTLNVRPRISGGAEDEVSMQTEVIVNELGERQRVFAEDLLGIPNIIRRQYVGQNRVKNHRPIVLGGLIAEKESESVNKIPILGDVPYLGFLFRRTVSTQERLEVIFILTPHILNEKGWDRFAAPKESIHFDTYDSVLFNDSHVIKGRDVIGIDPITGNPASASDGKVFTESQVVDLTLLNIAKQRELISKLNIIPDYLGDAARELNWIQRKWPEATVHSWPEERREIFFRAAAILIENIKELNPDLSYEEIVVPRRTIILPTTPYRISLSYDKVKGLQEGFAPYLEGIRAARMELTEKTIALLRDVSDRSLRDFARYLEDTGRKAEDHGEVLVEIKRLYSDQEPTSNALEGVSYPEVYRALASARFDFVSLATYFRTSLADRYRTVGAPGIGLLDYDLEAFLKSTISLSERARKLMELDARWERMNRSSQEDAPRRALEEDDR